MRHPAASFVLCCAASAMPAAAQQMPAPSLGVLNLSASASVEVARDLLAITFAATREGSEAGAVQASLKQALDAALAEARKSARPGAVDVRTGHFAVHPRHGPKGSITGWVGTAELTVEGRDIAAIAQLAGRLPTMTVARVGYGLSREARERVEADATSQAIARYRARAAELAKQFGYSGYEIREVNVSTDEPPVAPMMRERAMAASADMALPVEPGQGTVTAIVNGSVQMK